MKAEELEGKRIHLPYASGATGRVNKVTWCAGHHGGSCDIVELEITTDGAEQTFTMTAVKGEEFSVVATTYTVIGLWADGEPLVAVTFEGFPKRVNTALGDDIWEVVVAASDPLTAEFEALKEVDKR